MVKIIENKKTIKLQRGNRIIERDLKNIKTTKLNGILEVLKLFKIM
jgi:hypothetical protein